MSIASDCGACISGDHDHHDRTWNITPGLIGGAYCACLGDCGERPKAVGDVLRSWFLTGTEGTRIVGAEGERRASS